MKRQAAEWQTKVDLLVKEKLELSQLIVTMKRNLKELRKVMVSQVNQLKPTRSQNHMSESSGEEDLQGVMAPVVSIQAELKNLENEKTKMENCI